MPTDPGSPAVPATGPVGPPERVQLIDALRGFALLGILLPNWANTNSGLARAIRVLVEGKFWTMYSLLFGLGFALQLIRVEQIGRPFVIRYLWRLLILAVIGAVHRIFIWDGDILLNYALLAWPLLFVRRWRPSLIVAGAAVMFVLSISGKGGSRPPARANVNSAQGAAAAPTALPTAALPHVPAPDARCRKSPDVPVDFHDYGQKVCAGAARTWALVTDFVGTAQGGRNRQAMIFCMFLLGLYAGRRRIFHDVTQHTRLLGWVAGMALIVGVIGSILDINRIAFPQPFAGWRVRTLNIAGLSLFYLSSVALLFANWPRARGLLEPFAAVGRMSLTNYLMQSVMFSLVLGRGFGLIAYAERTRASVRNWTSVLLIMGFFVVQILYSRWWFRRFRFGPVEWAWRSLTWLRIQPMTVRPDVGH